MREGIFNALHQIKNFHKYIFEKNSTKGLLKLSILNKRIQDIYKNIIIF